MSTDTNTKQFDADTFENWIGDEYQMLTEAVQELIDDASVSIFHDDPEGVLQRLVEPYRTQLAHDLWHYSSHDAIAALRRLYELKYVLFVQFGFIKQLIKQAEDFIESSDEADAETVNE
jgi:hypothetical protein